MQIPEIKTVCFIGAGTIGAWNSLITAAAGYEVIVYDISQDMLDSAPERQKHFLKGAVKLGAIQAQEAEIGLSKITYTTNLEEAISNADLISESVPEKIELKRSVFKQLDEICPEKTIFTTNTSSLLVSEIEDAVVRRDKFAAFHFHLYGGLVDIVAGPKTAEHIPQLLYRFCQSLNQTPIIHTAEKDGYLWNTLLILNHKNSIMLVLDGYGSIENVDRSYMAGGYNGIGPFGQLDMVGIDLARDIFQAKYERDGYIDFKRCVAFFDEYIARGEYGMKTGKGFYSYPKPLWQQPEFLKG
ncbi:hypothetical protein NBRC116188_10770 [Oceaniserpentilla sp. 4NH20-0058]|uniref:3-hydroxyacyl-CoA dehydrogenase NAD-binding domain-containing protein n=1 Tax=Oceaniserpentilla sp. 4NH20-0058 TaxID=3127660 RepID=UPI00310B4D0A